MFTGQNLCKLATMKINTLTVYHRMESLPHTRTISISCKCTTENLLVDTSMNYTTEAFNGRKRASMAHLFYQNI